MWEYEGTNGMEYVLDAPEPDRIRLLYHIQGSEQGLVAQCIGWGGRDRWTDLISVEAYDNMVEKKLLYWGVMDDRHLLVSREHDLIPVMRTWCLRSEIR